MSELDNSPPHRTATVSTTGSSEAIPEETGEVGKLLIERLRAWKHAVAYLQAYVEHTETMHKGLAKDYHKLLKTIDEPLKEGHHFGTFPLLKSKVGGWFSADG